MTVGIGEQIEHERLCRLYEHWLAKRGGRLMPMPHDIDPLDLKFILGNLILVDVDEVPPPFHVCIYGSNLAQQLGYDMTGRNMAEHPVPRFGAAVVDRFTRVTEQRQPFWERARLDVDGRQHRFEGLILPLSQDDRSVDRLLVGLMQDT